MASHDWNRKWSSPPTPLARPPQTPTTPLSSSRHVPSYTTASPYAQTAVPRTPLSRANSKQPWRDISEEEKQEIRMAFELFDLRNVGKLNYRELKDSLLHNLVRMEAQVQRAQELFFITSKDKVELRMTRGVPAPDSSNDKQVVIRALEFNVKKEEVKKLLEKHCKDGGNEVNYEEFLEIMIQKYKEKDPDQDVLKAFRCFDEDSTGKISLKNLRKITKDLGESITDQELMTMIDEFDKDGDGEISEAEFFSMMKRSELE